MADAPQPRTRTDQEIATLRWTMIGGVAAIAVIALCLVLSWLRDDVRRIETQIPADMRKADGWIQADVREVRADMRAAEERLRARIRAAEERLRADIRKSEARLEARIAAVERRAVRGLPDGRGAGE